MHAMTAANLRSAFGGESMAHMRYMIWAEKARSEKFPNVARLFEAVSFAETVHAGNHFKALGKEAGDFTVVSGGGFGMGKTVDHLLGAIEGETFEIEEMYPAYIEVAKTQKEKDAERTLNWAMAAEEIHAQMYKKAKAAVDSGKDAGFGPIQVCDNCGHTAEGDPPERCPVCGVPAKRFKKF